MFYRNQDVLVLSVFEKIVYYGPYQFVTDDNGLECNLLLLFTNFSALKFIHLFIKKFNIFDVHSLK